MAHPLPSGLTPSEIAFLCEMELVTIIPRQRLESLHLIGGTIPALRPPHRAAIPLWFALLLKKQRRADIVPPPWLHPDSLSAILEREMKPTNQFDFTPNPRLNPNSDSSPPFQNDNTAETTSGETLPYHWLELAQLLLAAAADDIPDAETVRRLLRDLREVRLAKFRANVERLEPGAGLKMNGVGAMELGEGRAFLTGVVDGLRKLGKARETADRERAEEDGDGGLGGRRQGTNYEDDDEDMIL